MGAQRALRGLVVEPAGLRHVLEHVLDREGEGLAALAVAEQRAHEVVLALRLGLGMPSIRSITPTSRGMGTAGGSSAAARDPIPILPG